MCILLKYDYCYTCTHTLMMMGGGGESCGGGIITRHGTSGGSCCSVTKRMWRTFLLSIFVSVLLLVVVSGDEILEADKPIPIEYVDGVLGGRGRLPCDVHVPSRDDKLQMVLWFRDKDAEPIYRYDVRDKPMSEAKRSSMWGDRLYFQTMSDPAHLSIQDLQMKDEGVYRCRVDFKNSPTRNIRINLTIIVPPETPVIVMNDANGILTSGKVGPYNEGSALRLTCEVSGGRPKPTLKWWLENEMIDGDWVERNDGVLVNTLHYPGLRRHHLNSKFVCQATNTNLAVPKSASVIVDMNLRPLEVTITTKDTTLLAERRYDIECLSGGSRPPAIISWWKNSRQVKKAPVIPDTDDLNITRSLLSLTPSEEDDGKILTCRAENHWIPGSAIEDRWRLTVLYPPKVSLQLGTNMVADDIKEGDDVYFECGVKSNPHYTRLSWFHNGRELRHNTSQRVIMANTRLVLQKISRHTAGNYTCSAQNAQGSTQSNPVHLRVKFVPTCKHFGESLVGAMKQETIQVVCEMASDPPSVQFSWTFNNSGSEVIHVPQYRYTSTGTMSTLTYTPTTEMDYGTMTCWGSNSIGKGVKGPCYFQIVSAGRPFPPKNCSIFNKTEDSLSISCQEGFNGGLPQHFILEVVDLPAKKIKMTTTQKSPTFSLEGMEAGIVFRFIIYSVNDKGRSEPFILDGITFRGVAKLTGSGTSQAELSPLFAVLVGCVLVLLIVLILAVFAVWKKARRKKPQIVKRVENGNGLSSTPNNIKGGNHHHNENEEDEEDSLTNPDVVPNKNGRDRGGGIRGLMNIYKTPPARRRKKEIEVKNNGEGVALTLLDPQDGELHRNHNHKSSLLTSSSSSAPASSTRESRI